MTNPAGLTLGEGGNRGRFVCVRHHRVDFAVTICAARQNRVREFLRTQLAVGARRLLLDDVVVTGSAVDGIEPAFMPSFIGADVAVETLSRAVNSGLKLRQVRFVAVEARICLFGIVRCQGERKAGKEEEGDAGSKRTHSDTHCCRMVWLRNAYTYYEPAITKSQHPEPARNTDFRATAT